MENSENIVLVWLQAFTDNEDNLRKNIDSLREIINDIRIFCDRDQCFDFLSSFIDQIIFLVLGSNQTNLLDVLSTFDNLHYVYLTERPESPYTSQVRGVFPDIKQLADQLKKDIKTVQNSYVHLSLTKDGDLKQPHASTKNLQHRKSEFKWITVLFNVLLRTERPTENIYKDLIDECRHIYRGNEPQMRLIDEFAKQYEPSKAIWWYTRDTFIYRLVNMALRTENMFIIWKFRYIIQDIYHQLKSMHKKQRSQLFGNQQQRLLTVYRAQRMSLNELESLKNAEGDVIAVTSFLSITRDPNVASMFGGNDETLNNLKSVLFEIFIEESDLEEEQQRPFADIHELSFNKVEVEILLCMGTLMRIESVELGEGIARIRLHTICRYNDSTSSDSTIDMLSGPSSSMLDEMASLCLLGKTLTTMGECEIAGQFYSMINSSIHPMGNYLRQVALLSTTMGQMKLTGPNHLSNYLAGIHEMHKGFLSLINNQTIPDDFREIFRQNIEYMNTLLVEMLSKPVDPSTIFKILKEEFRRIDCFRSIVPKIDINSTNLALLFESLSSRLKAVEPSNEQMTSTWYDTLNSHMNEALSEGDRMRPMSLLSMSMAASMNGDYDRAIAVAQEGLSLNGNRNIDISVRLYETLAGIYKKQRNWFAVIASYQSIIDMPQLPPSSSAIVEAYIECGNVYIRLGDLNEAYCSYEKALELQNQHHASDHPLTSKIYIELGDLFRKAKDVSAALAYYEKVITIGSPLSVSEAYQCIGIIHMGRKDYDAARSNFMKCLDIRENSIPHETYSLALIHIWLAKLENSVGHHLERDFHIEQAKKIPVYHQIHRDFIMEQISELSDNTISTSS